MAEITSQTAVNFVNEQLRPLAELLRAANARMAAMELDWFNGVNNDFAVGTDTVTREGEDTLTGEDVVNLVTMLIDVRQRTSEVPGRAALLEKFSIRPIEVT